MNDVPEPQHLDEPEAFVLLLSDFIESTEAAELDVDKVRRRLQADAGDSGEGG